MRLLKNGSEKEPKFSILIIHEVYNISSHELLAAYLGERSITQGAPNLRILQRRGQALRLNLCRDRRHGESLGAGGSAQQGD